MTVCLCVVFNPTITRNHNIINTHYLSPIAVMDVSLKIESSESVMSPSGDERPAATESTASISSVIAAHHVEQLKEPTPVLLCEWYW